MTTAIPEKPLLCAGEAAEALGVNVETLRRGVREGTLPGVRFRARGNLYFRRSDLDRLIAAADPVGGEAT